jgi:hypothetical protein
MSVFSPNILSFDLFLLLNSDNFLFRDDDKPKKAAIVVPPSATSSAPKKRPQEETMMDKPSQDLQEKVVGTQPLKCRKRMTQTASVSLEAHQPSSSSDHVSTTFCTLILCLYTLVFLYSFALHPLMQRFLSLGIDCVKIQEVADESKGIFPCSYCSRFVFLYSIPFAHIC